MATSFFGGAFFDGEFFFSGQDETGGKRRFKRRGRKREFAFLEDIEDLLLFEGGAVEESPVVIAGEQSAQQAVQAETARLANEEKAIRRLAAAYQTDIDSLRAARALIEERKRELLIEDEMAMMIVLMAGLSDDA